MSYGVFVVFVGVNLYSVDYTILEFSQESGYLSLTHSARERLNISTRYLYISKSLDFVHSVSVLFCKV